jgi:hypothetical protein
MLKYKILKNIDKIICTDLRFNMSFVYKNQSRYRPEMPTGFQKVKVLR